MTSHTLQDALKAHEDFVTAQTPEAPRFILPLLRLLASGKPIEPRHLASVAQCSLEEIRAVVLSSDAEVDQAGHIVGWGLSLVPTPHQFHLGEHLLYTWCALDALVFPALLSHTSLSLVQTHDRWEVKIPMRNEQPVESPVKGA